MNSDLHIQCNKYLQNLTARHSAILETDTAAELAFFQEAAANFGKLIEYISIVKEMEDEMANRVAKLKQLGVDIGIPPIVQQPGLGFLFNEPDTPDEPVEAATGEPVPPQDSQQADPTPEPATNPEPEPEPQPEPEPEPPAKKNDATPTYTDVQYKLMGAKPGNWTRRKRIKINEHPEIHPDDISQLGVISEKYWTWDEVEYLNDKGRSMTKDELVKAFPEHTEFEILQQAMRLNIPLSCRSNASNEIELYLPVYMRSPETGRRIRIFRAFNNMTLTELSKKALIEFKYLSEIESCKRSLTTETAIKLCKALGVTRQSLTEEPIGDILPFEQSMTVGQRLRIARIRSGWDLSELNSRCKVPMERLKKYEDGTEMCPHDTLVMIAGIMRLPLWVLTTADPYNIPKDGSDESNDPERASRPPRTGMPSLSTGELIAQERIRKGWSQRELAKKAGISTSYISSIEDQRNIPSEDVLGRIAQALSVKPSDIRGNALRQPKSYFQNRTTQRRSERDDAANAANNAAPVMPATPTAPAPTPTNTSTGTTPAPAPGLRPSTDFSGVVKAYLKENRLTQQKLADKAGVPVEHVRGMVAVGRTYSQDEDCRKVSLVIGINLDDFGILYDKFPECKTPQE